MKAIITGGSGFVGQNLVPYLEKEKYETVILNRQQLQEVTVGQLNEVAIVIHLAGKAHDLKKTADPNSYYQINYEITKKLYDVFLESKAKKFVFISSVKAVADSVVGSLTEDETPQPKTDYGKSKLMAEEYIRSQPLPTGKSFYILRPCMIHGPGNKGNLNLLYKFVKKGIPYPLAAFANKRSFLSVTNLCFVIAELLKKPIESGIFNVADDEPLSTNQVINVLAEASNIKPKLWHIPIAAIKFLAKMGDLLHLPLTTERLQKLTENYVVDNSKIKKELHLQLPITTKEGLILTVESFATPIN